MTKQTKRPTRTATQWAAAAMCLLFAWLMPQQAQATHVDEAYNYQVMLSGANTIRIQVPVYDQEGADCWVSDGYLKVSVEDENGNWSSEANAFHWWRDGSTDSDSKDIFVHFNTAVGGHFEVTQGNSSNKFTFTKEDGEMTRLIYRNTDGNTYDVYVSWRLPYNMLGKKLKFHWDVQRKGTARYTGKVSGLKDVTFTMPKAQDQVQPQITTATISYSEVGKLELPWFIASNSISKASYSYTDDEGTEHTVPMDTLSNSGLIYLDATVPHNNFRVTVTYRDNSGYQIDNMSSTVQNLTMVHAPVGFIASPLGNQKSGVLLTWTIEYPGTQDLLNTDFFEVQRSLTGEEADFETIGTVPYIQSAEEFTYSYTDSTLVSALDKQPLANGGTLDKLTYRIRRMITQNWGWTDNPASATARCIVDDLHLLRIANYSAKWEDERAYTARVSWEYANEYGAVWDDRAQMILRVTSKNRDGLPVDTIDYVLNADERADRYKVISLNRPCVDYNIEVFVDKASSPVPLWNEISTYFYPIYTSDDWDNFRQKVKDAKGKADVNARLYADIRTNRCVGDVNNPYCGVFDGNGHTITVNLNTSQYQMQYLALFQYTHDATIRNLHVDGRVESSMKFAAGLLASVTNDGNTLIENCRVSATVESTIDGDATNGGIVGNAAYGNVVLRNCQFDGSMAGANCYMNGGLVGWGERKVTIENCLFSPKEITTKLDGCATFSRHRDAARYLTVRHSYATVKYDMSGDDVFINSVADWEKFRTKVKEAKGNRDINAVLNADIYVTTMVGEYGSIPYRGTFDGNGHTLTINILQGGYNAAPFPYVGDVTIKNLHVAGYVTLGGQYASGLIGEPAGNNTINVEKVWVSAAVSTNDTHCGGIIGSTGNAANVYLSDVRFDGGLSSGNYCGAIIAYGDPGTWNLHRVYDKEYFGDGSPYYCIGANYKGWGGNGNSSSCVTANDWNYVQYYNKTNQDEVASIMNGDLADSWKVVDGKAIPVMTSEEYIGVTAETIIEKLGDNYWQYEDATKKDKVILKLTSHDQPKASYPVPTLPTFHHESMGKVEKTLRTETRQSSVLLTWETDGNPIDYFTVLRRVKGTTSWDQIATDLDDTTYEDNTVSPLVDYEYVVRGTSDCEGSTYSETEVAAGACKHTGKVDGYVRFADGTGVPGIQVSVSGGSVSVTVTTDETGYFMAEDLSYQDSQSITYDVRPLGAKIDYAVTAYSVTFNAESNYRQVHEFIVNNSRRFTGYVMYEGTSIPVKGVRFLVNGVMMHNAQDGYVETDFEGKFEFRVLEGINVIQAVKEGHTFTDGGYFKSSQGYNFTDDVAQIYFYDDTRVKLTGRVVGGDDQGSLPLDNNLSRNNLGDDLTLVLTLEGDNTSWLVYDNRNPQRSSRDTVYYHPAGGGHLTQVTTQRKRMVVKPDSITGEYMLMLPPVRWKVQQVYCQGYPTLFQDGMVSEVIDLTDCLEAKEVTNDGTYTDADGHPVYHPVETYNATYSRIYHSPVEITYRQIGYDDFDYFGDKTYRAQTAGGTKVDVPLVYQKTDGHVNPFDASTHTPKLTGTAASSGSAGGNESYEMLFDGQQNTKWCSTGQSSNPKWWVNFHSDYPVSVKQYILTTGDDTEIYTSRNPKTWRLKAKANESDTEWVTIAEVVDDTKMKAKNFAAFTFDVDDHGFYQYFRFEVDDHFWASDWMQLSGLDFVCRGQADDDPAEDHGAMTLADAGVNYTFGYPVFSLDRRYPIEISVGERYYYNNNHNIRADVVRIGGGKVTVHNGLKNGLHQQTVLLDSLGMGSFFIEADQTTRLLTGTDALHTVTMTLEQDGTTYEAEPLRGYVLNMFATGEAKDVLVNGWPQLFDILRDPPGGSSTATLSKGSKLKYTYTLDMNLKAGLTLSIVTGSYNDNYQGVVTAPSGAGETVGVINHSDNEELINTEYAFTMEGKRAFSYTMNINEDITTSSASTMVGADADIFIGMTQNIVVTPMNTIRAIPDSVYQHMLGRLDGGSTAGVSTKYGSVVEIAKGRDGEGNLYHLIRDESLAYGPEVSSHFVHSQKHILTELIPAKVEELRALMYTGSAAEAQAQADATGKPVYRSLVDPDDENFGMVNTKNGETYYYTSTMPAEEGMNYVIHLPSGTTDKPVDEVAQTSQIIVAWLNMVEENEREKYFAYDLVTNYDVDGGSKVTYSEQFESDYTISNYYHLPGIMSGTFFDKNNADTWIGLSSVIGIKVASFILSNVYKYRVDESVRSDGTSPGGGKNTITSTTAHFWGSNFKFSLLPVLDYNVKDVSGESKTFTRKESFTISMDKKSHLNFDVYRVQTNKDAVEKRNVLDVYTGQNMDDMTAYVETYLKRDNDMQDMRYPRGFVYRTRGGATVNPWEDARKTLLFEPGITLDERTKKITNPKITVDKQSISGVPYAEPARFKVYLTNDSEQPEAATGGLSLFNFYLVEGSNPNGAKVYVDGHPLTHDGMTVQLTPGSVMQKTVEVYAGEQFDYEGLTLGLTLPSDWEHVDDQVKLDVHYLRQAGPVNISSPGDKWVMNTDAQYNEKRGWYLPVTIDGFDKHQHNFDHIEFQYKETQRGDEYWTNLCSFYADSTLYAKASGVREMIPENGNIETQFYGDGTVMEKAYDIRAVLYCRDGNSFLTTPSKVMSGIKDTRRPQLFGTPEPVDGILSAGENIVFNFSEDIEYNYLDAKTNFEVKGEVNNDNVSEAVSILFDGNGSVETEARRNFSGKDVTIEMMVKPQRSAGRMPLFSHGTNGKKLQLWLESDLSLSAYVGNQHFTTDSVVSPEMFTQVAMTLKQPTDASNGGTLSLFRNGIEVGKFTLEEAYNGNGPLIFGRTNETNRSTSSHYKGRMMEARLWYRALDDGLLSEYGGKRLTGYEMGLVDYYPMNEGSGDYAIDHTQGATAQLYGAAWAMPRGLSLHLEWEDHGIALNQDAINRTAEQDYSLMFWFKTDTTGRGVLISNGAGHAGDIGAENQFCIGFEAEKLMFRSNGMAVEAKGDFSDSQWHHYALTVNRARNVANIYVDANLMATFSPDSLGGISGGHPFIGAACYDQLQDDGTVNVIDTRNWLRGNIDEICVFAQALPLTLIKSYATKSPNGDEAGLLTYLSFDRQERQKDNDIVLVPYPYSRKIYFDDMGNVRYEQDLVTREYTTTPVRDWLFGDSVKYDDVMAHIDGTTAAPVVPYEELKNLNFSFVGKDNQVMVYLNELNSRINRRNVYVTVRDIEDKNGNAMASPATACYYVNNSSLQWLTNRESSTVQYGVGDQLYFIITNSGASSHTYTIENCPKWLTLNSYSDVVASQDVVTVIGTVNKNLNVGTYDEIIYLTDEDGVSEPLYLNLTVEGETPDWAWNISGELLKHSMNIAGRVYVNNEIDIDSRDIVGAFDRNNVCHGYAHVDYSALTGESNLYLTVYDSEASGRELYFKLWQYSTGRELQLSASVGGDTPAYTLKFQNAAVLGTDTPVRFDGGLIYAQNFDLKKGWNWVSFNISSERLFDLNNLLDGMPWKEGDVLTDMNSDATLIYRNGHWLSSENVSSIRLSPKKAYAIMVQEDTSFPIAGAIIKQRDSRTIEVKQGWNGIGYTPMLNLPVETALSDYYDKAQAGDVIKSHDEFAYFTVSGGVGRWRGSLEYMKPGEGYLLLRKDASAASFVYPFYDPTATFFDEWSYSAANRMAAPTQRSTMSVSAVVEGVQLVEGDRLVAYADGERVGEVIVGSEEKRANDPLYLTIGGDQQKAVWFAVEREDELIAATPEQMTFTANAVMGTPEQPTVIRFIRSDYENGHWYTTTGILLPKRPTAPGVYIYNGKKIVVR